MGSLLRLRHTTLDISKADVYDCLRMNTPFRKLVDRVRRAGTSLGDAPVTFTVIAKRCRITRPFLYALMSGAQGCGVADHYRDRIAEGLGVSRATVDRNLPKRTR